MNRGAHHEVPAPDRTNRIEALLSEIRDAVCAPWYWFLVRGLLYSAGFAIGTALTITLASYLLQALGVIPGLGGFLLHVRALIDSQSGHH